MRPERHRARFMSRFERVESGCWLWRGRLDPNGYGRMYKNGTNTTAHRVSYEYLVGPIPEGLHLDHLCRVRSCVRPDHLQPVTPRENILRGHGPTARNAAKAACKHGHPLTGANLYWVDATTTSPKRQCRMCVRNCAREMRARRSAKGFVQRAGVWVHGVTGEPWVRQGANDIPHATVDR